MSAMQKGNKHEGYTNNTSEGLDGTFYSAFYYIHFETYCYRNPQLKNISLLGWFFFIAPSSPYSF